MGCAVRNTKKIAVTAIVPCVTDNVDRVVFNEYDDCTDNTGETANWLALALRILQREEHT